MGKLIFKRIMQDQSNLPFDCGVESINEYVRNSYFPAITKQAYVYCIMAGTKKLGYYQVLFREIEICDFPEEISDYYDYDFKGEKISALHIRFIAIDEKYQRNKIGKSTLQTIIKDVEELSNVWPIRVVTIDARHDLVGWYEREGFVKMKKNTEGQDISTVAMYFDCMKNTEELQNYIDGQF